MVGQHAARPPGGPMLDDLLDSSGCRPYASATSGELSQGHRQLVSIARALASGPQVLLLDEPAAGLDTTESLWLADRLRDVRDTGVTIVLVDHDMHLVLGLCDEIDVLDFGRSIASGPPEAIRADPAVAEAYLGVARQPTAVTAHVTATPVLECRGCRAGYDELTVARDIDLAVDARPDRRDARTERRRQDHAAAHPRRVPASRCGGTIAGRRRADRGRARPGG